MFLFLSPLLISCPLSAMFGSGFESDEELPPAFPLRTSGPAYSLPDSDGYYSHGTQTHTKMSSTLLQASVRMFIFRV